MTNNQRTVKLAIETINALMKDGVVRSSAEITKTIIEQNSWFRGFNYRSIGMIMRRTNCVKLNSNYSTWVLNKQKEVEKSMTETCKDCGALLEDCDCPESNKNY